MTARTWDLPAHGRVEWACTCGPLTVFEVSYPSELRLPPHSHEGQLFLTAVLDGGFRTTVPRGDLDLAAGNLLLHAPDERRSTRFASAPTRLLNVRFEPGWPVNGLRDHLFRPSRSEASPMLRLLVERLRAETLVHDSPAIVESLVLELLSTLDGATRVTRRFPSWVGVVRQMVDDSYRDSWTVAELAARVGVHPIYLHRQFKGCFGLSIGSYVRRLRIEDACVRLRQRQASLSAIAGELGFADQAHFSRTFRRLMGVTPGRYRSRHREEALEG